MGRPNHRTILIVFAVQLLLVRSGQSIKLKRGRVIQKISVSSTSLNLSSGETLTLHVLAKRPAHLQIQIIDRDGYVIRTLPPKHGIAGDNAFVWNGDDDEGRAVPDEAYSLRVVADDGADEYIPAARAGRMIVVDPLSYSRTTATLTYMLEVPSRVHVQAGTVRSGADGPVLKTIVDRQPRDAGKIAEHWSGFDESGSVYVPDLPGFAVAIAATPLPENSVITFGNAKRSFLEYAAHRRGPSSFPHRVHAAHHAGLDVFNDVAPRLIATLVDGRMQLRVDGPTANTFVQQPGKIFIFVDSTLVATRDARKNREAFDISLPPGGEHIVAVNWRSEYGPVAVAVARIGRQADARAPPRSGGRP